MSRQHEAKTLYIFKNVFITYVKTYNPHSAPSHDNINTPVYRIFAEVTSVRHLGGDSSMTAASSSRKKSKLRVLEPYKNICCNTIDSQLS